MTVLYQLVQEMFKAGYLNVLGSFSGSFSVSLRKFPIQTLCTVNSFDVSC